MDRFDGHHDQDLNGQGHVRFYGPGFWLMTQSLIFMSLEWLMIITIYDQIRFYLFVVNMKIQVVNNLEFQHVLIPISLFQHLTTSAATDQDYCPTIKQRFVIFKFCFSTFLIALTLSKLHILGIIFLKRLKQCLSMFQMHSSACNGTRPDLILVSLEFYAKKFELLMFGGPSTKARK